MQVTQPLAWLLMAPGEGVNPAISLFVQLALIFMIFYWLLIRPQRKEKDRHQAMITALRKGDEVVTVGGIIGTIVHVTEDRLTVKTGENTRLILERNKVSRKVSDGPEV